MTGPRFAYSSLLRFLPPGCSAALQAEVFGVCRRSIWRYFHTGLDEWKADRFACRIGVHPSLIWSDWWMTVEPDEEQAHLHLLEAA